MSDEQINIDIRANDDASQKLDDVADKVEVLEEATPTVDVTADTAAAEADLKAIRDEAERVAKADAVIKVEAQIDAAKGNIRELKRELDTLNDGGAGGGTRPAAALQSDIDGVTASTEKAKGTMSGFIGNAVSELPGLGDAFGPAAEGLGQITEGALAGGAAISSLAVAGAGIVTIALAVKAVGDNFAAINAQKALNEEQVDKFAEAIRQLGYDVDDLQAKLRDGERLEYFDDGKARDATDSVDALGLKYQDLLDLIADQRSDPRAINEFQAALIAADTTLRDFVNSDSVPKFASNQQLIDAALDSSDPKVHAFGETMAYVRGTVDNLGLAQVTAEQRQRVFGDSAEVAARKQEEMNRKLQDGINDFFGLDQAGRTAAGGVGEVISKYDELKGRLQDRSAYLDVQDALDRVKQAAIESWTASVEGATDAEQKARDHERAVIAAQLAVAAYGETVGTIPAEATTKINAAIDAGSVDGVKLILEELEKERVVVVRTVYPQAPVGGVPGRQMENAVGRAETNVNVTVNMPAGSSGPDVLRAIGSATDRSGELYGGG